MDTQGWEDRYRVEVQSVVRDRFGPTRLVVDTARTLPPGTALDLACGSGRNALWLAAEGWQVEAVDSSPSALTMLSEAAHKVGITIDTELADLQSPSSQLAEAQWDLLLICYYLQRDLLQRAKHAVRPGGVLLVIVHITEGDEEPTPSRLRPGELERFFDDWEILHRYEGKPDDPAHRRSVAEVVARKPGAAE